jgi:tetratricopeptide (TPR) repeat protein
MQKAQKLGLALVTGMLALGSSGCLKKLLLDGQIKSTRTASAAVNSISDYEVARGAAMAGVAQFEGLHYLAPDNQDGMFLLLRGWAGAGFGFVEDEMEQAEDLYGEESELAEYHKARAVAAYARAGHYGKLLLESKNPGFEAAQKNVETMKAWTAKFTDAEDAGDLLWAGQAWMSRINLLKDDMGEVGKLYIGVELVRRSVELDEKYNHASGHTILGSYHSRSPGSPELDEAKKHFERALQLNEGKMLLTKFNYATKYYCNKIDKDGYVKTLNDVLGAGDVLPEQRLPNTIAKRRARRYLSPKRMKECGFPADGPAPAQPTKPAKPGDDDDKDSDKE